MYISNAFSLNMIDQESGSIRFEKVSIEAVKKELTERLTYVKNCIGHADTDRVVRAALAIDGLPAGERSTVALVPGDHMIVAQYKGPRLQEGATSLPDGATIEWYRLVVSARYSD